MAETYDILCDGEPVGTARVEKAGLYRSFFCRCYLPREGLYRIHAICGENREDLGICIPIDDAFGMDKKIPAKRLGDSALQFELVPKDWQPQEQIPPEPAPEELFIPVSEEESFEHLDKLENAVMEVRDGEVGILVREELEPTEEEMQA